MMKSFSMRAGITAAVLVAPLFLSSAHAAPLVSSRNNLGELRFLVLRPTYLTDLSNPTSYYVPSRWKNVAEAEDMVAYIDDWIRTTSYGQANVTATIYPPTDATRMVLTRYPAATYPEWTAHSDGISAASAAGISNATSTSWFRFRHSLLPSGFDGQAYVDWNSSCGSGDRGKVLHELTHSLGFNHGEWAYDGKLSAPQRIYLKWLTLDDGTPSSPTSGYILPTSSGIYRVYDLDTATKLGPGKPQCLYIERPGQIADLTLEFRPSAPIQGNSGDTTSALGLRLINWDRVQRQNIVIDAHTGGPSPDYNRALLPGIPWTDTNTTVSGSSVTGTGVEITVLSRQDSVSPKYLDVRLKFPGDPGPVPAAPTGFNATASTYSTVQLTWTDASADETGFRIERSTSPTSGFVPIHTTGANATSFTDTGLGGLLTYHYRLVAVNVMGDSTSFATASVTTPIEPPGSIRLTSASHVVGDVGGTLTITAERIINSGGIVSVDFNTADGSASAGADYVAANGTLTWADHESGAKTFEITILDDNTPEPDETFEIQLGNPTGGAALATPANATVTITERPGFLGFSTAASTAGEESGNIIFVVQRTGGKTGAVSATFSTVNGTALAGTHYTPTSGNLNWADGDTSPRQISVPIINNPTFGSNKTFAVQLADLTGGALPLLLTTNATLINDDPPVLTITRPASASFPVAPNGNVQFSGTVNEDDPPAASSLTYSWSVLAAPSGGSFVFAPTDALNTLATVSTPSESTGNYAIRVTATDGRFTTSVNMTAVVSDPVILTQPAQPITLSQATLRGELLTDAGLPTQIRCYFGDNDGDTDPNSWDQVIDLGTQPVGPLASVVTGLVPGPVYYFRFRATNGSGDHWSFNSQSFQIQQWSGQTSSAWATDSNWSGGIAPANNTAAAIALFNLPSYGGNPVFAPDAGTRSIAGITLGAANGPMTLSGNALTIGASGLTVDPAAGNLTISAPTTLAASQTWTHNGLQPVTHSAPIARGQSEFTLSGNGNFTLSGNLSGSAQLTKSGNGTLTLSGNNSGHSGAVALNQGTLAIAHAAALGTTAVSTEIAPGATLRVEGGVTSAEPLLLGGALALGTGTNTLSGNITLSGNATLSNPLNTSPTLSGTLALGNHRLTVDTNNGTSANTRATLSGPITGTGSILKTGSAQLVLSNNGGIHFSGGLLIQEGSVRLDRNLNNSTVTLSGNATLGVGANSASIRGLTGPSTAFARSYDNAGRTLTLNTTADTVHVFDGRVDNQGTFALAKSGPGTQVFNGPMFHAGTTTVNGGTLVLNGTLSTSATAVVNVNANATLAGIGTINRTVTVNASATLAPGHDGIGNLTVASLTFDPASTYQCELGGNATSDRVIVAGNATLDGTLALNGTLAPGTYRILTCAGILTNNVFNITGLPPTHTANIVISGGNVDLVLASSATSSFAQWKNDNGLAGGADPSLDHNGNGAPELFDFLFANDRVPAGPPHVPTLTTVQGPPVNGDPTYLQLEFRRRKPFDGVAYQLRSSTHLGSWTPTIPEEVILDGSSPDYDLVALRVPLANHPRLFLSLAVWEIPTP
jgi:autotransporter-associated beta strand protein